MDKEGSREKKFYDVDSFLEVLREQRSKSPPARIIRWTKRVLGTLGASLVFLATFLLYPFLAVGALGSVLVGIFYGPLAFLGVWAFSFLGLSFYVERKVGRSLVFADYSILRRATGQILAFLALTGILTFIVFIIPMF